MTATVDSFECWDVTVTVDCVGSIHAFRPQLSCQKGGILLDNGHFNRQLRSPCEQAGRKRLVHVRRDVPASGEDPPHHLGNHVGIAGCDFEHDRRFPNRPTEDFLPAAAEEDFILRCERRDGVFKKSMPGCFPLLRRN